MPIVEWLRGDLKDYARALLLESPGTEEFFDSAFVGRLWNAHQSGLSNFGTELWILMMFSLWHRRFVEQASSAPTPV